MTEFADAARAAAQALRDVFPPTPLQRNVHLSERYGADIWLKREDLSPVRSYKIRGAFNAMRKRLAAEPEKTRFVCASAGNHAQGVAYACAQFGCQGTIFMPVTTPQQKIQKTRMFGAGNVEIRLVGDFFDESLAAAQAFCAEENAHFLSPFDDAQVIEGQASVAVEMVQQLGRVPDHLVLPVGGGGLSAGMTTYLRSTKSMPALTLVEPVGGPSLTAALAAGELVEVPITDNFVDGAAVARIGGRNFEALKSVDPASVKLAPENRICVTIQDMLNLEGIVLEPAGAMVIDVLEDIKDEIRGKTVVCVSSGGNFDFERLPEVKERAMRYQGLKKYFILRLPQRPGALREFLSLLGPDDDIARFEYLKKSARNFGSVMIGIEAKDAESFASLSDRMQDSGFAMRDITDDELLAEFLI